MTAPEEASPRTALVVDDDASARLLLTKFLERQGFAVTSARDGSEAIRVLTDSSFDFITLDLMMPGVDGEGVVRFLQQTRPEQLRHVVIVTAYPEQLATDPGVCAVVSKPFTFDLLADVLGRCA